MKLAVTNATIIPYTPEDDPIRAIEHNIPSPICHFSYPPPVNIFNIRIPFHFNGFSLSSLKTPNHAINYPRFQSGASCPFYLENIRGNANFQIYGARILLQIPGFRVQLCHLCSLRVELRFTFVRKKPWVQSFVPVSIWRHGFFFMQVLFVGLFVTVWNCKTQVF